MRMKLDVQVTLEYEKDGEWYVGQVVELPGAISQGRTLQELQDNILEAIQLVAKHSRPGGERVAYA